MINKDFWRKINSNQADYDKFRRLIIGQSAQAQHLAKQAIFALHRDNMVEAEEKLAESQQLIQKMEIDFKQNQKLRNEPTWSSAVEEFAEAKLFLAYQKGEEVGEIVGVDIHADEYVGGLSDFTGELHRQAVLLSSKDEFEKVKKIAEEISDIIHLLLEYNLGGYLRTKFDQAKKNLNKIEYILYDINMKKK